MPGIKTAVTIAQRCPEKIPDPCTDLDTFNTNNIIQF